jgi:hypothetical protein
VEVTVALAEVVPEVVETVALAVEASAVPEMAGLGEEMAAAATVVPERTRNTLEPSLRRWGCSANRRVR